MSSDRDRSKGRLKKKFHVGVALTLGLGGACLDPPPALATPPADVTPAPGVRSLNEVLATQGVDPDAPARKILYTWTTADQVALLRGGAALLTREKSPTRGFAVFDRVLRSARYQDHPVSKLLMTTPLKKRRFAWPNAWATVRGWGDEAYGLHLLQVRLKDEAIIGIFTPGAKNFWRFVDMKHREVSEATLLAQPGRLAAIYHMPLDIEIERVWEGTYNRVVRHQGMREYVLCNESMIEGWSYASSEIQMQLENDLHMLYLMREWLEDSGPRNSMATPYSWRQWLRGAPPVDAPEYARDHLWPVSAKGDVVSALYWSALAFANPKYTLSGDNLRETMALLKQAIEGFEAPIND